MPTTSWQPPRLAAMTAGEGGRCFSVASDMLATRTSTSISWLLCSFPLPPLVMVMVIHRHHLYRHSTAYSGLWTAPCTRRYWLSLAVSVPNTVRTIEHYIERFLTCLLTTALTYFTIRTTILGVGQKHLAIMPLARSPQELTLMMAIKRTLDPHGILNPGKVLPPGY